MKILDRHVLREFASACVVAFSFFTLLFLALHLFTHISDFGEAKAVFAEMGCNLFTGVCRYYAATLPFIIASAGPFAMLMAGMWAAQRLAKDAETVAAQAAGIGLRRFTAPMLWAGVVVALALSAVRQEILPGLALERLRMERALRGQSSTELTGAMIFEDAAGYRIHVASFDPSTRVASGVRITARGDLGKRAEAARMRYEDGRWVAIGPVDGDATLVRKTNLRPQEIEFEARGLRQLRSSELADLMSRQPDRRDLRILWQAQFTYPVGALVLLMLGIALVLRGDRRNVYAAAGTGVVVSVVYFAVENVLQGVAEREYWLPPLLAAWMPPLVFGAAAAMIYLEL